MLGPDPTEGQFVVENGCLAFELPQEDELTGCLRRLFEDTAADEEALECLIQSAADPEVCEGGIPVGPLGFGDQSTGSICLDVGDFEACAQCAQGQDTWSSTATVSTTFIAQGELSEVPVTDCDGAELTFDINEGDTVTLTQALRFLYEVTEELSRRGQSALRRPRATHETLGVDTSTAFGVAVPETKITISRLPRHGTGRDR